MSKITQSISPLPVATTEPKELGIIERIKQFVINLFSRPYLSPSFNKNLMQHHFDNNNAESIVHLLHTHRGSIDTNLIDAARSGKRDLITKLFHAQVITKANTKDATWQVVKQFVNRDVKETALESMLYSFPLESEQ